MITHAANLDERVRSLPKAHLHLHFPRTVRPGTLTELAARAGIALDGFYKFTTLAEFLGRRPISDCISTPDDLRRLCYEMVEDEARDGVAYTEPMVVLHRYVPRFGTFDQVLRIVRETCAAAGNKFGVEVGLMVGFSRHSDSISAIEELARFAARHAGEGVVAFGFGGDEERVGPAAFAHACAIARDAGLLVVPHAGEVTGSAGVAAALNTLQPHRIAHGVRAVDDERVLARLAREGVTCDLSPTSNVRLGVVRGIDRHPLPRMMEAGVPITLNADDPVDFGVTCSGEYALSRAVFGLSDAQLAAIARTSALASGASSATKARMLQGIQCWLDAPATELPGAATS